MQKHFFLLIFVIKKYIVVIFLCVCNNAFIGSTRKVSDPQIFPLIGDLKSIGI